MKSLIITNSKSAISFDLIERGIRVRISNKNASIFDWDYSASINLSFEDICEILQVFRGECEALRYGDSICHSETDGTKFISLRHEIDPIPCYRFVVKDVESAYGIRRDREFIMNNSEALGVCEALAGVLHYIAFGV